MTSIPEQAPTIKRIASMFRDAFRGLEKHLDEANIERLSVLIHASMSGRRRSYHTIEHVFTICDGLDPIGVLSGLFHDTVCWDVDGGLPRGVQDHLADAFDDHGDSVTIRAFDAQAKPVRALTYDLFGVTTGQSIWFRDGLNEIASGLLAAESMSELLSLREIAEVVTCIEATIPFRDQEAEKTLASRLMDASQKYKLGLDKAAVEEILHRAVVVANHDVGNFAYHDTAAFLAHTWEIIPEVNPTLQKPAYTLSEYRQAMNKMFCFMASLNAERVFRIYDVERETEVRNELLKRATVNLERGARYLKQKTLAARLLESLSMVTGGDAPVSLFTGDLPGDSDNTLRLEHLLPPLAEANDQVQPAVLTLLTDGRARDSGFDLNSSPLAARLYALMGDGPSDDAMQAEDGWAFLEALPRDFVITVAKGVARLADTRADQLAAAIERLST